MELLSCLHQAGKDCWLGSVAKGMVLARADHVFACRCSVQDVVLWAFLTDFLVFLLHFHQEIEQHLKFFKNDIQCDCIRNMGEFFPEFAAGNLTLQMRLFKDVGCKVGEENLDVKSHLIMSGNAQPCCHPQKGSLVKKQGKFALCCCHID